MLGLGSETSANDAKCMYTGCHDTYIRCTISTDIDTIVLLSSRVEVQTLLFQKNYNFSERFADNVE